MKLKLIRKEFTNESTIGELWIDDKFFSYTLEDKDRGLNQTDSLAWIKTKKIFGVTAIPYGTYKVILSMSNRFKRMLPAILDVKGYEGVRIHRGNYAKDTLGCLLVGYSRGVNCVLDSRLAELALVNLMEGKQNITLEIVK